MNAKRILCPIDFSDFSEAALQYASSLAQEANAMLYLVHVDDSQVPYDAGYAAYVAPPVNPEALMERLVAKKPSREGVRFEHHLLFGHPADAVVEFARQHEVDLIVMGTHGRTGLSRILMGSIAEAIVRRAECPVLTVKTPIPVEAANE